VQFKQAAFQRVRMIYYRLTKQAVRCTVTNCPAAGQQITQSGAPRACSELPSSFIDGTCPLDPRAPTGAALKLGLSGSSPSPPSPIQASDHHPVGMAHLGQALT
jgi:hypothetical protein